MSLLGAILAGGKSARFGSDKAMALLDGRPLVAHAVALLQPYIDEIVICGPVSPVEGVRAIRDRPRSDLGPLGGLCAALNYAAEHGHEAVIAIGCDTPIIPGVLLARLASLDHAAYLSSLPVIGRWPVELAALIERRLDGSCDYRVRGFAEAAGAIAIFTNVDVANLNRPEDLARLQLARDT